MTNPAVLFDFDGTLVPNLDLTDMRRQIAAMAKAAGVPDSVYDGLYIVEIIEASQAWLSNQDTALANSAEAYAAASHQRINDIEMQAASNTAPFTAVRPVLNQLRDKGYRLGIVTRNCRAAVLTMFPDMDEYVDCLHARDDVVHLKPDPRHLQDNLDALGAEAALSVMVGDGALDMQAGQALGMRCVGVLTGSNDTQALTDAGATEVLADYRGLVSLLI
ncbi:MAG: HAD family hydrolase [Pseudomonadales bacterium]|nr:HAD family hydrolase [Pseudomonadales bacterium]MBL6813751.1 HAD family hydrolase [Pseudomonadales bacterium]